MDMNTREIYIRMLRINRNRTSGGGMLRENPVCGLRRNELSMTV